MKRGGRLRRTKGLARGDGPKPDRAKPLRPDPEKVREQMRRYNAARRMPRACAACGVDISDRPSRYRTCSSECARAARAAAKTGDQNPMRQPEVVERMNRTTATRRVHLELDVPGSSERKCRRPGCQGIVSGSSLYCSPRCHYDDRARVGTRRAQPYHRCATCRRVFAWNGAGKGVFCSAACIDRAQSGLIPEIVDVVALRGYQRSDWNVPLGLCVGCGAPAVNRHHVVYAQHVVRAGGDRWDPTNQAQLCETCHGRAHARHNLPISRLSLEALEFAFALLGPAASVYLRRRYAGEDERMLYLERTYPTEG